MQINITARHLKLTDSIDSYVRRKIAKAGKFYSGDEVKAYVILSVEKRRQITEIIFHVGKLIFRVKEHSSDLYTSIDLTLNKLTKQLKKQKEISKIRRKESLKVSKDEKLDVEEKFSLEDSKNKISEIKRFDLKAVTVEKAVHEMDSLGYKVYMFRDAEGSKTSVLYRDENGVIVLLEPNVK
jgi:putative sigma-54 modulation protein